MSNTPEVPGEVSVPRDFLVRVDSYTSLVAHRHPTGDIPRDVVEELKRLSVEARGFYEGRKAAKRTYEIGFKGGPWAGRVMQVEHIVGPLLAVGDPIGNHYYLDSNSGMTPTYHWDDTEWEAIPDA